MVLYETKKRRKKGWKKGRRRKTGTVKKLQGKTKEMRQGIQLVLCVNWGKKGQKERNRKTMGHNFDLQKRGKRTESGGERRTSSIRPQCSERESVNWGTGKQWSDGGNNREKKNFAHAKNYEAQYNIQGTVEREKRLEGLDFWAFLLDWLKKKKGRGTDSVGVGKDCPSQTNKKVNVVTQPSKRMTQEENRRTTSWSTMGDDPDSRSKMKGSTRMVFMETKASS